MKKKTTYYWMTDLKQFGKYDGQNYYILINGKWMSDNDRIIFGKLIGYDEFEPDDSPYAIGSTSVMDTIKEITEEQFNEMYNSEEYDAFQEIEEQELRRRQYEKEARAYAAATGIEDDWE